MNVTPFGAPFAAAALLVAAPATAECRITDHRHYAIGDGLTVIEGAATCESGTAYIRAYDGGGGYLGNALGEIAGHTLTALLRSPAPEMLRLDYTITLSPASPPRE